MKNVVILPWPPKELSPNASLHWSKKTKKKKAYRTTCWALTLEAGLKAPEGDGKIEMEITFCPPDKRPRDADNMVAAIKSGLDGVADALKVNDKRFLPSFVFTESTMGRVIVKLK